MADRFQRLYSLTPNLYIEGCPVLIEAGALQKDTESGAILAQIKMQNIGEKAIASCKISLNAYENNGDEVEGVSSFSYLDLNAEPGMFFGGKTPVIFPNQTTRSYSVVIKEIVFTDGTVETCLPAEWKTVPPFKALNSILKDAEIEKQYGIEVGENCEYVPERRDGLFLCTCGGINNDTNPHCCKCGRSFEALTTALNTIVLEERAGKRLTAEKAEREENARKKEESKKKTRKTVKSICIAVAALLLVISAYKGITTFLEKRALANKYSEAKAAYDQGDYLDAAAKYDELGDYENSKALSYMSLANYVSEQVDEGNYSGAARYIPQLKYYSYGEGSLGKKIRDSFDKYYDAAVNLVNEGKYDDAEKMFNDIDDYKDSQKYISYCWAAEEVTSSSKNIEDLTEIYQLVTSLNNFNNANELIDNNEYLSKLKEWEGEWEGTKSFINDDEGPEDISLVVKNGELDISGWRFNLSFKVENGIINVIRDGYKTSFTVEGDTVTYYEECSAYKEKIVAVRK